MIDKQGVDCSNWTDAMAQEATAALSNIELQGPGQGRQVLQSLRTLEEKLGAAKEYERGNSCAVLNISLKEDYEEIDSANVPEAPICAHFLTDSSLLCGGVLGGVYRFSKPAGGKWAQETLCFGLQLESVTMIYALKENQLILERGSQAISMLKEVGHGKWAEAVLFRNHTCFAVHSSGLLAYGNKSGQLVIENLNSASGSPTVLKLRDGYLGSVDILPQGDIVCAGDDGFLCYLRSAGNGKWHFTECVSEYKEEGDILRVWPNGNIAIGSLDTKISKLCKNREVPETEAETTGLGSGIVSRKTETWTHYQVPVPHCLEQALSDGTLLYIEEERLVSWDMMTGKKFLTPPVCQGDTREAIMMCQAYLRPDGKIFALYQDNKIRIYDEVKK